MNEIQRIADVLQALEVTEEALAVAKATSECDWSVLMDDASPLDIMGREVVLLTKLEAREKEIEKARGIISSFIVAMGLDQDAPKHSAMREGRIWLKRYNDCVHPVKRTPSSDDEFTAADDDAHMEGHALSVYGV
ncbi:hypothetical protein [Edaphobacter albus]|uniref:hypothetical protein n=1 Tax=Edaphobacter sp. 4G125 TaxID=2763071 RepID=UPI001645F1CC|nr:hypothetical protein [Edaphobacter sp. 4G125]QNI37510.1 hypothetical protein H7846_04190 [Edaphobacter sp. 4G125]